MIVLNDDKVEKSTNGRLFPLYGMMLSRRAFGGFLVSVALDRSDKVTQ
jgi:hypothetical protein